VSASSAPPSASRRVRSSSAGTTTSQLRTASRTGPGSIIRASTLAGSGIGAGASSRPNSVVAPSLTRTTFQPRSMTTAGNGSCWTSIALSAAVTRSSCGLSSAPAGYRGAYPAASRSALRSRSGTSSARARRTTMRRLGCARPVSRKLT